MSCTERHRLEPHCGTRLASGNSTCHRLWVPDGTGGLWRGRGFHVGGGAAGWRDHVAGAGPGSGNWPQPGDRAHGTSRQGGCFGLSPHFVSRPEAQCPQTLKVRFLGFDP